MKDLKRAFGSPDPEFQDRVRQTLFLIEEKEESVVKKKLTFSMTLALILCICLITVSAFAGNTLTTNKPDVTQSPLSQSENNNPNGTPGSADAPILSTPTPPPAVTSAWAIVTPMPTSTLIPFSTPTPAAADAEPVYVWSAADDMCYHVDSLCAEANEGVIRLSLSVAENRGQIPCPSCIAASYDYCELISKVYLPENSKIFHKSTDCTEMSLPCTVPLLIAALEAGAQPCPLCCDTDDVNAPLSSPVMIAPTPPPTPQPTPPAESGYYYTPEDWFCHADPACLSDGDSFIGRAFEEDLIAMGKRACETCMEPFSYYYTPSNAYYHAAADCAHAGLLLNEKLPEDQLIALGKRNCPWCLGWYNRYYSFDDRYYHASSDCASFIGTEADKKHADEKTLLEIGWLPCETCFGTTVSGTPSGLYVFSTPNGVFYHTVSDCMGLKNAENVILSIALDRNQTPCPICSHGLIAIPVYLWNSGAPVYHAVCNCSGYEYLHQMELADAVANGLTPCPECLNTEDTVWYAQDGEYYHSHLHYAYLNLPDVIECTPFDALAAGKRPCPNCMLTETAKGDAALGEKPPLWATGNDEIYFYDASGHFVHMSSECSRLGAPIAISAETAIRFGFAPCENCSGSLNEECCIPDGALYHLSASCAGLDHPSMVSRWTAKASSLTPCPDCAYTDIDRGSPIPTVPPQPAMPPSGDQQALKQWLLNEGEQRYCLTDLGYYSD